MHRSIRPSIFAALAALALVTAAPVAAQTKAPPLPADSLELGRKYARWFMAGHTDSLWAVVIPGGSIFASRDALAAGLSELSLRAGAVTSVVEERFVWRGANRQYWHTMRVTNTPEPLMLRLVLLPDGRISGAGLNDAGAAPPFDSAGPVIKRN